MVLPQPAGAPVAAAALLEAMAHDGGSGAAAPDNLRIRLAGGELQMLTSTCATDLIPLPPEPSGSGQSAALSPLILPTFGRVDVQY